MDNLMLQLVLEVIIFIYFDLKLFWESKQGIFYYLYTTIILIIY